LAIDDTLYVSVQEAIKLHVLLMREWGENRFGIECKDLLESALSRPKQAANFANADLIRQAATLCFGLVKNHPWFGGNKRTATFLTETFLEMNGFELTASDDETYEMVLKVESDAWKLSEIENWLRERVEKI
jgi:death on curing protein